MSFKVSEKRKKTLRSLRTNVAKVHIHAMNEICLKVQDFF